MAYRFQNIVFMACPLRSWTRIKTASVKWATDFKLSPHLGCFDIVFQRPYRVFSITLTVILALSDRYEISPMIDDRLKFVKM